MPSPASLRPIEYRRVMDLVRDAGIDVSNWANYAGGPPRAAANPKYCYEWAFVRPAHVVVLNVWYRDIRVEGGRIIIEDNLRASAAIHAAAGGKVVWRKRAERFDDAVRLAAKERLPVRAIICDGDMRDREDVDATASRVTARTLDPVPWAVSRYDAQTGQFELTRGALPHRLVDQFAVDATPSSPTETRDVTGKVFVRDPEVRRVALVRAGGKCEWCQETGFTMDDGSVFLETHHVVPLSDGGPDSIDNVAALCPNHHREAHYGQGEPRCGSC